MILDFRADRWHAMRHDVICARTGEPVAMPIWYADDELGLVRRYIKDAEGGFVMARDGTGPVWEERRMDIRIVPKSAAAIAAIEDMERRLARDSRELMVLARTLDDLRYGGEATRP